KDASTEPGQNDDHVAADAQEHGGALAHLAEALEQAEGHQPDGCAQWSDFTRVRVQITTEILPAPKHSQEKAHDDQSCGEVTGEKDRAAQGLLAGGKQTAGPAATDVINAE